jgi:DNA-binding FrmR family transcriptional regulator
MSNRDHYSQLRVHPLSQRNTDELLAPLIGEDASLTELKTRIFARTEGNPFFLVEDEKGCAEVLHLIVAARGALNSLMTEVIEDHIRLHMVGPAKDIQRLRGAEELIEAMQSYLK